MSPVTSPSLAFLTLVQFVQRPAKATRGRFSSRANQTGTFFVIFGSSHVSTDRSFHLRPASKVARRIAHELAGRLPSIVSYSLNEVKGTRQRCSGPSQRFQCALDTSRMFVVPESGPIRRSSLKSMVLPLA